MNLSNNINPTTLSECFDILTDIIKESEDREWFKKSTENEVVSGAHHGLGEWVRNKWNLWDKSSPLYKNLKKLGLWHADDMSSFILISYHRLINDKDLDLSEQVKCYINYWSEYEKKFGPTQK